MDLLHFFSLLGNSAELIRAGGYLALAAIVFSETGLLFGFFLPGDSLLVTAGLFAATGQLEIMTLLLLLTFAAIAGDATGYWIGRSTGPLLFRRPDSRFFRRDHLLRSRVFYERHGGSTIILARFVPVMRTFVPVLAGVSLMNPARFLFFNATGGLLWVGSMTLTGFLLGRTIPGIDRYIELVIAVVIAVSLLPVLVEALRVRRRAFERRQTLREITRQAANLVVSTNWNWSPGALQSIAAGLDSVRRAGSLLHPADDTSPRHTRVVDDDEPRIEFVVDSTGPGLSDAALDLALLEMQALYPETVDEVWQLRRAAGSVCDPCRPSHCWAIDDAHLELSLEDARPEAIRILMTVSPLHASAAHGAALI